MMDHIRRLVSVGLNTICMVLSYCIDGDYKVIKCDLIDLISILSENRSGNIFASPFLKNIVKFFTQLKP